MAWERLGDTKEAKEFQAALDRMTAWAERAPTEEDIPLTPEEQFFRDNPDTWETDEETGAIYRTANRTTTALAAANAMELPPRYKDCRFETFDESLSDDHKFIVENVFYWVTTPMQPPYSLILAGSVGSGKTHLAVSCINWMVTQGRKPRYIKFSSLAQDLTSYTMRARDWDYYDVMLIDDVGDTSLSEQQKRNWNAMIDYRIEYGRPMIMTSNLKFPEKWIQHNMLDERIKSRLVEGARCIHMDLADYRLVKKQQLNKKSGEMPF